MDRHYYSGGFSMLEDRDSDQNTVRLHERRCQLGLELPG
jgi:hypothetical protein